MKRGKAVGLGLAVVVGLGAGDALAATKVKIGYIKETSAVAIMVIERNLPKGITVEKVDFKRYGEVQTAVSTGDVDFGTPGYSNIPIVLDKNLPNFLVLSGMANGGQELVVRKGVTIRSWKDLEGKNVGVAPGGTADLQFTNAARENGADLRRVKKVAFPRGASEMVIALERGDVDAASVWEPFAAQAVVGGFGYYSPVSIAESSIGNLNMLLAAGKRFVDANPKVTLEIVRAVVKGTDFAKGNPEETVKLVVRETGARDPIVKTSLTRTYFDVRMPAKTIRSLVKAMLEIKAISKDVSPQIGTVVKYEFLAQATGKSPRELGAE